MTKRSTIDLLEQISGIRLLCVGDVMLDRFVYGQVSRISPEAPVPILKHTRTEEMPGGAGNVARNLATLGAKAVLIGVVGDDAEGRALADLIGQIEGVEGDLFSMRGRPTTLKTRFVTGGQQLLRVDAEDIDEINAVTETEIIAAIFEEAKNVSAIVLSDYAKGIVTSAVVDAAINAGKANNIPVMADPKRRDLSFYGGVDVLKPNAKELAEAANMSVETDAEAAQALAAGLAGTKAKTIVVTRAAKGMSFQTRGEDVTHRSGDAREVYDVSGAGDTSMAALAVGLAAGGTMKQAVKLAIAASGIAVGKVGTAAVTLAELRDALRMGLSGGGVGSLPLPDLQTRVSAWRDAGLTIGFTNGCFDIIHPGHLKVLEEAKARCGRLVVGLNSDASVKRLKGEMRPVNDEVSRARVLNGLSAVDAVIVFDEDTPADLISAIGPDLLVKGGDYTIETIVGARDVIANGGQVHIVPIVKGQSTTAAIARAKA